MSLFNPIQYTSRTFESILQDINNDSELVDKPNWWKRGISGVGDVASMWNNATANNLLLSTSFTRRNVQLLLELIDYTMAAQATSSGTLIFYIDGGASFPFTVAQTDLVGLTAGTTTVSAKRFEARGSQNVTLVTENVAAASVNIGTDALTVTRDFTTGEKIRVSTSGTLPSPLTIDTDYYVIRVSATEIKLATTLANALAGTQIDVTTQGTGTHTVDLYSVQVTCYQQLTRDSVEVGDSDGATSWQEFDLPDVDILQDTLIITINAVTWTRVTTFVDSTSTDKHYRLFFNTDNTSTIQFGDGTYGEIPPAFAVQAEYATGGGSESNVSAINSINVYGGSDSNIESVANVAAFTGGAAPQSIAEAKVLGPLLLKARDRFITGDDGESLSLAFGGIAISKVIENAFGVLSARVLNIANGGGTLSSAIKASLQQYLIDRTVLESIDVRVEDPTITPINVTASAKVLSGYTWSGQVENWYRLAWKLFFSEAGKEILEDYNSNGIDSARALINTVFSESFNSSNNTQIQTLIEAWNGGNLSPRDIGENDIQESDASAFVAAYTEGVDYISITAPTFPISIAEDEITTPGTLSLSEIP